jgi:hypothetical protein
MTQIIPNPHVALNNARNLPSENRKSKIQNPKSSGSAAIERYIDQRDKLWSQLLMNEAAIAAAAISLLKDRNDFVEALFRFKKVITKIFTSERIEREQQRTKICEAFIDQLQAEQQAIIAGGARLHSLCAATEADEIISQ